MKSLHHEQLIKSKTWCWPIGKPKMCMIVEAMGISHGLVYYLSQWSIGYEETIHSMSPRLPTTDQERDRVATSTDYLALINRIRRHKRPRWVCQPIGIWRLLLGMHEIKHTSITLKRKERKLCHLIWPCQRRFDEKMTSFDQQKLIFLQDNTCASTLWQNLVIGATNCTSINHILRI